MFSPVQCDAMHVPLPVEHGGRVLADPGRQTVEIGPQCPVSNNGGQWWRWILAIG